MFHHAGIKIPYFAFFAHDSGIRCEEAPPNMLLAMAVSAALCIGIGVFPGVLYAILPFAVVYEPYTASHVVAQMQLLLFSALAFSVLMRTGIYPPELRAVNLDSDWLYRVAAPAATGFGGRLLGRVQCAAAAIWSAGIQPGVEFTRRESQPNGLLLRTWPTGSMALWVMVMLLAYLAIYYAGWN